MKIHVLRGIFIILLLGTFFIIFNFSSQNGETSGGISKKITQTILEKSSKYNLLQEKQKDRVFHRTESIIRKIAHFSIYTAVGFLLMGLLSTYKIKNKWKVIVTVVVGVLYAVSDEFHQSFSPGRTPKLTDVYIDTLGVILGMILLMLMQKIYYKNTKMTKNVMKKLFT